MTHFTEDFIRAYWGVPKGEEMITVTIRDAKEKNCGTHNFFKVKDLLNPKYGTFEILKKILQRYSESNPIAHETSNLYQNYLMALAAIYDNTDEETLEMWRKRLFSKFGII